jgi:nitrile hydratase subunit beta
MSKVGGQEARIADVSDMGGRKEFFGPVRREDDEPVFHDRWEARVFGVAFTAMPGIGVSTEAARHAMNRLPPDIYLSSYYRRWLGGLETGLVERGYLGPDEVDARIEGRRAAPGRRRPPRLKIAVTWRLLRVTLRPRLPRFVAAKILPHALGTARRSRRPPRFGAGDRVRVRARQAKGHTRQPAYVSGKPGVVSAHLGTTLYPDALAVGRREPPQHLYTVAFEGRDLFGDDADHGTEVRIDLYESYLEPA